jgi:hypothetical protein
VKKFAQNVAQPIAYIFVTISPWCKVAQKISQKPLHVQGVAGRPGQQGNGYEKNNWKKWRAEEEERHKGSLTLPKSSPEIKAKLYFL